MANAIQARYLVCNADLAQHPRQLQRSHRLSANQINKAKTAMDKFIESVKLHPDRRDKADPYYLIHRPEELVYGTALLFHGFGQSPRQCQLLAEYLFQNGFNIYQPCLARHYLKNANQHWPQVDLKPHLKETIRASFYKDEMLATGTQISPEDTLQRLLALSPDMSDILDAINEGDCSKHFQRFFDSTHLNYFKEAESRLEDVNPLPGPIFTIGISMGGATALSLANAHPNEICKTVGYAPLLKTLDDVKRQIGLAVGPLDIKDIGWEPELQFTMGCLAAIDLCGNHVSRSDIKNLAKVPTFLLFTENEDSADLPSQQKFAEKLKLLSAETRHLHYTYKSSSGVPHAMLHPNELPISNKYWKTMYQETFRFLTTGQIDVNQLESLQQDQSLPQVQPLA